MPRQRPLDTTVDGVQGTKPQKTECKLLIYLVEAGGIEPPRDEKRPFIINQLHELAIFGALRVP
jgi:hypothetical protein